MRKMNSKRDHRERGIKPKISSHPPITNVLFLEYPSLSLSLSSLIIPRFFVRLLPFTLSSPLNLSLLLDPFLKFLNSFSCGTQIQDEVREELEQSDRGDLARVARTVFVVQGFEEEVETY